MSYRVRLIMGLIGTGLLVIFIGGLSHSISTGFAGFEGGLPFMIIAIVVCIVYSFASQTHFLVYGQAVTVGETIVCEFRGPLWVEILAACIVDVSFILATVVSGVAYVLIYFKIRRHNKERSIIEDAFPSSLGNTVSQPAKPRSFARHHRLHVVPEESVSDNHSLPGCGSSNTRENDLRNNSSYAPISII